HRAHACECIRAGSAGREERRARPLIQEPAAAPKLPVTVVIAARNEGAGIAACIGSVPWAAEVLVVENDSTDETVSQAREAGATVFTNPFVTIGAQRNAAIARAANNWIFVLDA